MHNACVERHLVPAGHQERPERTASARRVAQNVVRRRPAAVGGAWAAGASVSGGDVTTAILRAHSARYYASLEAATARATTPDARVLISAEIKLTSTPSTRLGTACPPVEFRAGRADARG